jgi:hypothetical protein
MVNQPTEKQRWASTVYRVEWVHDGKPGVKEFPTLYHLGEWLQNLHYWGVKATAIHVQWEDPDGV